jgi:hypothetical protein
MSCGSEQKTHHTAGPTFSPVFIAPGTVVYESRSINFLKSRTISTKNLAAVLLNFR